jgi:hypothetical protein
MHSCEDQIPNTFCQNWKSKTKQTDIKFQVLKRGRSMGEINGTELGPLPKQMHNSLKSTHESATIPFK